MSKNEKVSETKDVHKKKQIASPKSVAREYLESFVITLVMAIFGMTFILQAVTVPTGSMQNTILIGDYLLVNKFIFAPGGKPVPFLPQREIQQGDIIVFKYPGNKVHPEQDKQYNPPITPYQVNYVKRVIGMPGDEVEFRNNQVFINGKLLPEYRVIGDAPVVDGDRLENAALKLKEFETREPDEKYTVYYSQSTMSQVDKLNAENKGGTMSRRDFEFGVPNKPMKVPNDSYFVMGDSRDNSADSRVWGWVNRDLIVGRAMFVYWSCDGSGGTLFSCITNPRLDRIGKLIK